MSTVADFIEKYSPLIDHEEKIANKRAFVRHPAEIPIEVSQEENLVGKRQNMSNVSMGGMAFESNTYWKPGTLISICVMVHCVIQLHGEVVWCQKNADHFDVGVRFLNSSTEDTDGMVEEVCQIEMYKKMLVDLAQQMSIGEEYITA
jgi:hypothetical protein